MHGRLLRGGSAGVDADVLGVQLGFLVVPLAVVLDQPARPSAADLVVDELPVGVGGVAEAVTGPLVVVLLAQLAG